MVNFIKCAVLSFFFINNALALETSAKQVLLFDLSTGETLFEKNSKSIMYPSSMSKLMTTYIAFQKLKEGEITLDTQFTISKKAWKTGGSKMFLEAGRKVTVEDLLRGIIVQSGNDAAITLAEGVSGDEDNFAILMNKTAKKIGLRNSNFANATGLPNENHTMTSEDLILLARTIIEEFPEYYYFFSEKEFTYNNITQPNRNTLIGENGIDGMKTGHTDAGGYGLVVSAIKNDRRVLLVVNGLRNDAERAKEVRKIIDYGYNNFEAVELLPADKSIGEVRVWYGTDRNIPIVTDRQIRVIKKKQGALDVKLQYDEPIVAPIKKGQKIAELHINHSGDLRTVDLFAQEDVEAASTFRKIFQNIEILFCKNFKGLLGAS